ncbi:MFS-type transporter SLC18B1 [Exaiptasia diaphana]|nr:MFS-type transporter SLC18B1 [Exaiptasia diaphana]
MPSGTVYIVFCFLLRIVSAIGGSMSDTAIFAIVAGEFPDNLGAVMLGGFKLPFLVLGGLVLLTLPMAMFVLPITGSCIILSGIILGFLDPTLSPHISTFGLNPSQIGLMFLLIGAVYAFTAPLVGWVGDKTGRTRTLITLGIVFSVFGYLLLGPSPLLTFLPKRQVWLAAVSLIMLGLAISFYLVPVMPDMMITARRNGLPDDIRTHGILSGIFGALISVGMFEEILLRSERVKKVQNMRFISCGPP